MYDDASWDATDCRVDKAMLNAIDIETWDAVGNAHWLYFDAATLAVVDDALDDAT